MNSQLEYFVIHWFIILILILVLCLLFISINSLKGKITSLNYDNKNLRAENEKLQKTLQHLANQIEISES